MIWMTFVFFTTWAAAQSVPEGGLTLEYVVSKALQNSDSFRALKGEADAVDVPSLSSSSQFDLRPYASVGRSIDKREPFSVFSTTRVEATEYKLGIGQWLPSGTQWGVELQNSRGAIGFAAIDETRYVETRGTLFFEQNLWRDAFGVGMRAAREAGRANTEALQFENQDKIESWTMDLIGLFYDAWLALAELRVEDERNIRQEKLVGWTEILVRRGNSERPDLLQAQSALSLAKISRARIEQKLGNRWRNLVTGLKFPKEWLYLDVRKIPLVLESQETKAKQLCEKNTDRPPTHSRRLEMARSLLRASAAEVENADSMFSPDLKLKGQLSSNGVDPTSSGKTINETFDLSHPQWGVALALSMPLQFSAERANQVRARAMQITADAAYSIHQDSQVIEWLNTCSDFARSGTEFQLADEASTRQKERAQLEGERFKLGRSGVFQVIQAEDDSALARVRRDTAAVENRLIAWKVRQLSGEVLTWIQSLRGRS